MFDILRKVYLFLKFGCPHLWMDKKWNRSSWPGILIVTIKTLINIAKIMSKSRISLKTSEPIIHIPIYIPYGTWITFEVFLFVFKFRHLHYQKRKFFSLNLSHLFYQKRNFVNVKTITLPCFYKLYNLDNTFIIGRLP